MTPHEVPTDPGTVWVKDPAPTVDVPPDGEGGSARTGVYGAVSPNVVDRTGGGFRMYYARYSAANRATIGSTTSGDGLAWRNEDDAIIVPGDSGPDAAKCSEMCVMCLPRDRGQAPRYRMFFEACDGKAVEKRGVWRIAGATSAA